MRPSPFRSVSTLILVILIVILALVIGLVVRDNASNPQPATESTSAREISTLVPESTDPSLPSPLSQTESAPISLAEARHVELGGFAFQPIEQYVVEITDGSVNMSAPDAEAAIGPSFVLIGGTQAQFIQDSDASLTETFEQFLTFFSQEDSFTIENQIPVTTSTMTGIAADITNNDGSSSGRDDNRFSGRVFMSRPNPPQFFVMVAIAPDSLWEEKVSAEFDAVLASVTLFELVITQQQLTSIDITGEADENDNSSSSPTRQLDELPPFVQPASSTSSNNLRTEIEEMTASSQSSARAIDAPTITSFQNNEVDLPYWRSYTNGNFVTGMAVYQNTLWATSTGGVTVWDQSNRTQTKYTTINGLHSNLSTTVAACPIRELGIIVGTMNGLQIFNLDSGSWSYLNSQNSLMSFNDVVDFYCDTDNGFMVLGYQRHGIDIFDIKTSEWLHFDRNRALVSDRVHKVAVRGNRDEIWVASDLGITVLGNILEIDNRRSSFYNSDNSPLQERPVDEMIGAADGTIWITQGQMLYRVRPAQQSLAGSVQREWELFNADSVTDSPYPSGTILSLAPDRDGTIWLGSDEGQICHFDADLGECIEFIDIRQTTRANLAQAALTDIVLDQDGHLYYSTLGDGISRFDGERWQRLYLFNDLLQGNEIQDVVQDSQGSLWVAHQNGIQQLTSIGQGMPLEPDDSAAQSLGEAGKELLYQKANDLFADRETFWIGTDDAAQFDGRYWQRYTTVNGLVGSPVQAIAVDPQGRGWFGTPTGLSILNEGTFFNLTTAEGLPNNDITAILAGGASSDSQASRESTNVVWIGTNGGGLLRFEKNQLELFDQSLTNLPSNTITALGFDADGSLLIGTDNGLARLVGKQVVTIRPLGDAVVTTLATMTMASHAALNVTNSTLADNLNEAEVWVGTQEQGVYHYNGFAWQQLTTEDNMPDMHISALLIDQSGTVWIGGATGGLVQHIPLRGE